MSKIKNLLGKVIINNFSKSFVAYMKMFHAFFVITLMNITKEVLYV